MSPAPREDSLPAEPLGSPKQGTTFYEVTLSLRMLRIMAMMLPVPEIAFLEIARNHRLENPLKSGLAFEGSYGRCIQFFNISRFF